MKFLRESEEREGDGLLHYLEMVGLVGDHQSGFKPPGVE